MCPRAVWQEFVDVADRVEQAGIGLDASLPEELAAFDKACIALGLSWNSHEGAEKFPGIQEVVGR
jgi:hypothetical protein